MSLKNELTEAQSHLYELADAAGKHENQHFADLIRHAADRLKDAIGHPDADREPGAPVATREQLDAQLAALPGDYTDADYVSVVGL